jgi:hypothetical protein
MGKGENGEKGK